jgi:hypothetical protein
MRKREGKDREEMRKRGEIELKRKMENGEWRIKEVKNEK